MVGSRENLRRRRCLIRHDEKLRCQHRHHRATGEAGIEHEDKSSSLNNLLFKRTEARQSRSRRSLDISSPPVRRELGKRYRQPPTTFLGVRNAEDNHAAWQASGIVCTVSTASRNNGDNCALARRVISWQAWALIPAEASGGHAPSPRYHGGLFCQQAARDGRLHRQPGLVRKRHRCLPQPAFTQAEYQFGTMNNSAPILPVTPLVKRR